MNVKKYKKKIIVNRIEKLLKDFEISETKKMSARNLSGGISQYISFLRSIVDKPNILILDEPCSNLDDKGISWYHKNIEKILKFKKIIVASNNKNEVINKDIININLDKV